MKLSKFLQEPKYSSHIALRNGVNSTRKLKNVKSINKFKVTIFNFIRPKGNSVFDIHDIKEFIELSKIKFQSLK